MFYWYDKLYAGEEASRKKKHLMEQVEAGKFLPGVYLISPSEQKDTLLDIYPEYVFLQPYYKKQDIRVLGIAVGRPEAYELVEKMVMECYLETGEMKFLQWMEQHGSFVERNKEGKKG